MVGVVIQTLVMAGALGEATATIVNTVSHRVISMVVFRTRINSSSLSRSCKFILVARILWWKSGKMDRLFNLSLPMVTLVFLLRILIPVRHST